VTGNINAILQEMSSKGSYGLGIVRLSNVIFFHKIYFLL